MAHVLVPHDGSEEADAALAYATELFPEARITLLTAIDPTAGVGGGAPGTTEVWYRNAREEAEAWLAEAKAEVEGADTVVETRVEAGRPAGTITEFAEEHDVDHVVMGSHGRAGVSRLLLGSVAEAVVRRSPVPVTVVR